MMTVTLSSTPSSSSSHPSLHPKPHNSTRPLHHPENPLPSQRLPSKVVISRRRIALSLSLTPLFPFIWLNASPAPALEFGISGPKDWLKEQKKKSIKYLLAPIVASREILSDAQKLLSSNDSKFEQKDMEEIQGMLNAASRDCVADNRSSLVAFQARTGVEVCTFKLVVTNASSLLNDNDPTKLEAEARLNDLIRSFTFLNGLAKDADVQLVSNRCKSGDVDEASQLWAPSLLSQSDGFRQYTRWRQHTPINLSMFLRLGSSWVKLSSSSSLSLSVV